MKKLLVASSILFALVMTGCASTKSAEQAEHAHPAHHKHGGTFEATYTCDHNTTFTAKYNPDEEISTLNFKGSEITLKVAPSGSGVRFVGENGNTKYDWHTKGKLGMLDVATGDKLQTFKCESKDFAMHEHKHGHHPHGHHKHGQKPHVQATAE